VASVATTADQTLETVAAGIGSALISEGNAALYARPGITFVPVSDLPPSQLALVWRRGDNRDVVRDITDYAAETTQSRR
jgi:DNA-binding transcriptional LysR family regulator